MLTELHIENLGVIDKVHLMLGPGLTALTGETGAGKTMLVEAIDLLVGGRADPVIVRPGAVEARVEGRFVDGDDEVVVARVVPVEGRSRAYVDGRLATAANLAELGSRWVDLHGQHSHQSLLAASAQRRALDHFGRIDLGPLRRSRERLAEIGAALDALGGDVRARAREIDLLRFQVDELERAALSDPDEDESLDRDEDVLAGAVEHRSIGSTALEAIVGDGGLTEVLGVVTGQLEGRSVFAGHVARLRSIGADLSEVGRDLRHTVEAIEEDPERLDEVRTRRQLLRELRRKYGETLAEVMVYRDEVTARLSVLEGYEERAALLEAEREQSRAELRGTEAVVGAARRQAAPELARAVEAHLGELAMAKAQLQISVGDEDPGDAVVFQLAANPGSAPLALAKVASGGELARTMLALRLVLSEAPDTLVFDEVDAGIGGAAANAVARALAALGQRHQVLVVTHLAQVAAAAAEHVVITKQVDRDETVATATDVRGEDRVDEIARMLSGDAAIDSARRHARDLLAGGIATGSPVAR